MKKLTRRDFIKISAAGTGALALGGISLKELLIQPELKTYSQTQALLGTLVTIKAIETDYANARNMVVNTFDEIIRLSSIFSRFNNSTEIYSLNATGYIIGASEELINIINKSIYYSELTNGLFDITSLPLLELNIDSFNKNNCPPTAKDIDDIRGLVGYKNIKVKGNNISIKTGAGVTLDGIAVGYIVDKATSILKEEGIDNVLVNGGGEIYTKGVKSDGTQWIIGVANPRGEGSVALIESSDFKISTSGDYEAHFTEDYNYNHIIDPRTGVSPCELSSATVIAPDTLTADTLSTALIVMGKDAALSLVNSTPGIEALLIDKNMNIFYSAGFPIYQRV